MDETDYDGKVFNETLICMFECVSKTDRYCEIIFFFAKDFTNFNESYTKNTRQKSLYDFWIVVQCEYWTDDT